VRTRGLLDRNGLVCPILSTEGPDSLISETREFPTAAGPHLKTGKNQTAGEKTLFVNLYVQKPDFGEHNFADFLDRIETVEAIYIRKRIQECYSGKEDPIEPYFFAMMRLTLSSGTAAAYIRTHPNLPITERDCCLSKLFQFLYVPLEIRFGLRQQPEWETRVTLEELLDFLPGDFVSRLPEFDWSSFFEDTRKHDIDTVVSRLRARLPSTGMAQAERKTPGRKRGPKEDIPRHKRIASIALKRGQNWRDDECLRQVCDDLDRSGIKVSPMWPKWKTPARSFSRALLERKHEVIKAIQYSIDRASRP